MPKCNYKTGTGKLVFEVTGSTDKEMFTQLSRIQEIFDAESQCGLCQSKDLGFLRRVAKSFEYFELQCRACGARFAFGQSQQRPGELFPKRRGENGPLPNGGWFKWEGGGAEDHDDGQNDPRNYEQQQPQQRPAGNAHNAKDLPYEAPPPNRGGGRRW